MALTKYSTVLVCGDDPADPSRDEFYVEISREISQNSELYFCRMRKRDGRIVVELFEGQMFGVYQHDFEELMAVLKRAGERAETI